MKHTVIVLVMILLVAFLVLPLVLISLGKLHSPLENIAVKNKAVLTNQNYIPVSADLATDGQKNIQQAVFDKELEKTCNANGVPLRNSDLIKVFDIPNKRATLGNDTFGFSWTLSGQYKEITDNKVAPGTSAIRFIGGATDSTQIGLNLWAGRYTTKNCSDYFSKIFGYYQDSGRFFEEYNWEKNGYALLEKGLSNINGHNYYWYAFENTNLRGDPLPDSETGGSLLTDDKYADQYFTVVFDTFSGNTRYRITAEGSKKRNKSYRNIIQVASRSLASLVLR